jgi:hypothetical protein
MKSMQLDTATELEAWIRVIFANSDCRPRFHSVVVRNGWIRIGMVGVCMCVLADSIGRQHGTKTIYII